MHCEFANPRFKKVMREHIIPNLYNTMYNMKKALEDGEEGYQMKNTHVYNEENITLLRCKTFELV